MKFNRIFTILFLLLIFGCDRDEPRKTADDCNGDPDGIAFIDNCGVCSGGNTGHEADSDIDCNNECFGEASVDSCGVCDGSDEAIDDCGVCFGNNANMDDSKGV